MTYSPSALFNEIGANCVDPTPRYTATLEDIGENTILVLSEQFGATAVRAAVAEVLASSATNEELDEAWKHTGARLWFSGGGTRHYFEILIQLLDRPK